MNAEAFLAIAYDKLTDKFPQYKFELRNCSVTMANPRSGINLTIFKYRPFTDEIVVRFIEEKEMISLSGHPTKTILCESIDSYKVNFYNMNNDEIDYIIDNIFSGLIQKQYKLEEDIQKDFI